MRFVHKIGREFGARAFPFGLAFTLAPSPAAGLTCWHPAGPVEMSIYGDVNQSGAVNVADLICVVLGSLAELAGQQPPPCAVQAPQTLDLNCDGSVTTEDALVALGIGLMHPMPPELDPSEDGCPGACALCGTVEEGSCLIAQTCEVGGAPQGAHGCRICEPLEATSAWTLVPPGCPAGAPCEAGGECASGVCESGVCEGGDQGSPLAHYELNGNAMDSAGGLHGTSFGALPAADRLGDPNGAMAFDGSSYIRVGDFAFSSNDFTVALWLLADDLPSWYRYVFAIHSGETGWVNKGDRGIHFSYGSNGRLSAIYIDGNGKEAGLGNENLPVQTWHHVAFTRDGNTQRLYIAGEQKASSVDAFGPLDIPGGLLEIGAPNFWGGGNGWQFNGRNTAKWKGKIDDVRVYDRALSASEIQSLAQ